MSRIRIVHRTAATNDRAAKTQKPLTHHEILKLIGPFSRRGLRADMTATQRAERRLVFLPLQHPYPFPGQGTLREGLELKVSDRGTNRLVRTLTATDPGDPTGSLSATLTVAGSDCDLLLDQIEGFPRERHFPVVEGIVLQRSYRLEQDASTFGSGRGDWMPVLSRVEADVLGIALDVDADRVAGMPAQVRLRPPPGQRLQVPSDLLAVIGGHFRPLEDYTNEWRGSIKSSQKLPARTLEMEEKLGLAVGHLAQTLSSAPGSFHASHRRARWRVAFRRGTPLLVALGLIAGTPAVSLLPMGEGTLLRMLIFHAPPLMLASFFLFKEVPRIEVPPLPRPLKQKRWLTAKS